MAQHYLRHWQVERQLLALVPGQVSEVAGVLVHRVGPLTWSVDRGPAVLLLQAIDAVMRRAGYVVGAYY